MRGKKRAGEPFWQMKALISRGQLKVLDQLETTGGEMLSVCRNPTGTFGHSRVPRDRTLEGPLDIPQIYRISDRYLCRTIANCPRISPVKLPK